MKETGRKTTVRIAVLAERVSDVRTLAQELGFAFTEQLLATESDVTKFTFKLRPAELKRLLSQFPRDAFAYRGVFDVAPE